MNRKLLSLTAIGSLTFALQASAVDFEKDLLPVLEKKCMSCHREAYKTSTGRTKKPKGGLRMDTPDEMKKGGDGESSLVAKDSAKSEIYKRVILDAEHDDFMPPKGDALTKDEVKALKEWIDAGAEFGAWKGTKFDAEGKKVEG